MGDCNYVLPNEACAIRFAATQAQVEWGQRMDGINGRTDGIDGRTGGWKGGWVGDWLTDWLADGLGE